VIILRDRCSELLTGRELERMLTQGSCTPDTCTASVGMLLEVRV